MWWSHVCNTTLEDESDRSTPLSYDRLMAEAWRSSWSAPFGTANARPPGPLKDSWSGGPGARSPWGESPQTFDYIKKLVNLRRAPQTFDYIKKLVSRTNFFCVFYSLSDFCEDVEEVGLAGGDGFEGGREGAGELGDGADRAGGGDAEAAGQGGEVDRGTFGSGADARALRRAAALLRHAQAVLF